jgi:ribosomal protein L37E
VTGHPYANTRIGVATIHGKERAIAPPFRRMLDAEVVVAPGLDTDMLGTFSGEVPRPDALVETCVLKAELAFRTLDVDCSLANEGSYGPIDRVPLMPSGMEIMAFIDRRRGVRLIETLASSRTNWRLWRFKAGDPRVVPAIEALGFPSFGVFVIAGSDPSRPVKDLSRVDDVVAAVDREAARSDNGEAILIADMRAHRNPTRMGVLRALAWKLAKRLERLCPKCRAPGFGAIGTRRGLPCQACGEPTHWIAFEVEGCSACGHTEARRRRDGRRTAPSRSCACCRSRALPPSRVAAQGTF